MDFEMTIGLIDLDELILRCRDERAREYIREAVSCYKAGAFRACIVATWIAVVFDFIHKLRELDLTGDKQARVKLEEFDRIREAGQSAIKEALEFERSVLRVAAEDYELLTPLERQDLERLQEDRNRCAHPSMHSTETPYAPTAELARAHLRNAVECLLEREPVQGKAAFDRIWTDVMSEYFPMRQSEAQKHFEAGPLVRARDSLVRNLVVAFVKELLADRTQGPGVSRIVSALGAIIAMHRATAERVLSAELPRLLTTVDDNRLICALRCMAMVPTAWEHSGVAMQEKAKRYVELVKGDHVYLAVIAAMMNNELKKIGLSRLGDLSNVNLAVIVPHATFPECRAEAVARFCKSASFDAAKFLGETLLLPVAKHLEEEQVRQVLRAFVENGQIAPAWGVADTVMPEFFRATECHAEAVRNEWLAVHRTVASIHFDANQTAALRGLIEKRFPEVATSGGGAAARAQ